MGYYSDTAIALSDKGVKVLNERLGNADAAVAHEVKQLLESAKYHKTDPVTKSEVWHWQDVKWYQYDPVYFPEIDFIEKLLNALDEDDFRFIRIGEDYDDTEVRGLFTENPFDLELARGILLPEL